MASIIKCRISREGLYFFPAGINYQPPIHPPVWLKNWVLHLQLFVRIFSVIIMYASAKSDFIYRPLILWKWVLLKFLTITVGNIHSVKIVLVVIFCIFILILNTMKIFVYSLQVFILSKTSSSICWKICWMYCGKVYLSYCLKIFFF